MKYMGSKRRFFKQLIPIILKDRKEGQYYVEPFCGGCNSLDKVMGNRIAGDVNCDLVAYFVASTKCGWTPPPNITEEDYIRAKKGKNSILRGYVGHSFSFGGTYFRTIARHERIKGGYLNLDKLNRRGLQVHTKQQAALKGVHFYCCSYEDLPIPPQSIIYCDPPYRGVAHSYYNAKGFSHQRFYDWCRLMKAKGHRVFVSEYSMPKDFKCVWEKAIKVKLSSYDQSVPRIEKLFTL